ncbi:hypothetical protein [uncultured Victivallis sp.]|mgnify:CR=1 FL=1|uniref:hypothetical protein n=1 Tax=uncultured Victivallis sp. TaxID=354118 RepID=UPI002595F025|nr:hypothetical protein [uncultured Victivallis sp.]
MSGTIIALCIITITGGVVYFFFSKSNLKSKAKQSKQPALTLTKWDLQCMSFHEAGHAVCSYYLPEREEILKITINPTEEAFGMIKTAVRPHHNETETSLRSLISTFLAGALAEELFLNIRTSSGIHDFANARSVAIDMVAKFGMGRQTGKITPVSVYDNSYCLFSEEFKRKVDEDTVEIIKEAETTARNLLKSHANLVINLAELLFEKQTLKKEEIVCFFNHKDRNNDEKRDF